MNFILGSIITSSPLLLASMAALTSEFSGCMALFLDGLINLCAFLCFAFTVATKSPVYGILLTIVTSVSFITVMAYTIEKLNANRFLAALAINLLCNALSSTLSSIFFNTRGVLSDSDFVFAATQTKLISTVISYIIVILCYAFLKYTKAGLYIRISGSDSTVLYSKGTNVTQIRLLSWAIATALGALAGSFLSLRISSFVPNISSGIGWTALAVVFLGKKNTAAIIAAVLVFSASQYGANNLQSIEMFKNIPPAFLLSMPYFCAILLILLTPQIRQKQ